MRHAPIPELELIKRAVRETICVRCYQRPHGTESLGPDVPRACEGACPLFLHLPALQAAAEHSLPVLESPDRAIQGIACSRCGASPTAGEFCSEFLARTCPLSRYGREVIEILQRLQNRHGRGHEIAQSSDAPAVRPSDSNPAK